MTIDERLEALAQTLELLTSMHRDSEQKIAALAERTDTGFERTDKSFAEVARLFGETDRFINSLAHIAEEHERRIHKLEDRQ